MISVLVSELASRLRPLRRVSSPRETLEPGRSRERGGTLDPGLELWNGLLPDLASFMASLAQETAMQCTENPTEQGTEKQRNGGTEEQRNRQRNDRERSSQSRRRGKTEMVSWRNSDCRVGLACHCDVSHRATEPHMHDHSYLQACPLPLADGSCSPSDTAQGQSGGFFGFASVGKGLVSAVSL